MSSKRGFTLIESAIVLGIVALVIGGIWAAASAVNTNLKIKETAEGILRICSKAVPLYRSVAVPSGGGQNTQTEYLIAAGAIPPGWVRSAYDASTPIGDMQVFRFQAGTGNTAGKLAVTIGGAPPGMCAKLVSTLNVRSPGALFGIGMSDDEGDTWLWRWNPYTGNLIDDCGSSTTEYYVFCPD